MNLGKLSDFAIAVVITAAIAGNLDTLNRWVQVATAKVLWESRASAWGSPRFWPEQSKHKKISGPVANRTTKKAGVTKQLE